MWSLFLLFWQLACPPVRVGEVPLRSPTAVATDVAKRVYIAEAKGVLRQYDSTGKQLAYYSPPQVAELTALEARNGLRVFAFYQDLQQITVLNRFLQPIEHYRLQHPDVGFVQNVAWSTDQMLWLLDSQDACLKKYNPLTQEVLWKVSLAQVLPAGAGEADIRRIQEYENRLYLFGASQVFVLDLLGNALPALPHDAPASLYDERLWTLVGEELRGAPLYKDGKAENVPFLACPKATHIAVALPYIWVLEAGKATIWRVGG